MDLRRVAGVSLAIVLVLAVLQVVLHLVAAGDVPLVLYLQLHQQVLLTDARQQLRLAPEVIAVAWRAGSSI